MKKPNVKYYQIPSKSQLPNPKNLVVFRFCISRLARLVVLVCIGILDFTGLYNYERRMEDGRR